MQAVSAGRWWPRVIIAVMSALAAIDATAQVVTVQFTTPPQAAPIPLWAVTAIAAMLVLLAYRTLRSRGRLHRLRSWLVAGLAAGALAAGVLSSTWVKQANALAAIGPTLFELDLITSPASIDLGGAPLAIITVVNQTGKVATLTGRSVAAPASFVTPTQVGVTECVVGLALQPGTNCTLQTTRPF